MPLFGAKDGDDFVASIRGNCLTDEGAIAILNAVRWTPLLWKLQYVVRFPNAAQLVPWIRTQYRRALCDG